LFFVGVVLIPRLELVVMISTFPLSLGFPLLVKLSVRIPENPVDFVEHLIPSGVHELKPLFLVQVIQQQLGKFLNELLSLTLVCSCF